jgi:regulatory protein
MTIEHFASKPDRAGRYSVRFDDGTTLRLYRQTVEDFGLYSGMELTEEEFSRLRTAAGEMSAKMRAVRIVAASNVSKNDLKQRLIRKGEDPDQAADAVEWMAELKLVDDRETARQIVSRCAARGYGLERARQALYEKRIPRSYWEEALAEYPDQTDAILSFLRTRPLGDPKDRKRAIEALIRRGHSYGDVRRAMRELELNDEFPEE